MLARSELKVDNDDKASQSLSAAKLPCSVVQHFQRWYYQSEVLVAFVEWLE